MPKSYPNIESPVRHQQDFDERIPDDNFEEFALLPHAPPTSCGTYLDGMNEGLESLEEYQEGGYHPVHLGDRLGGTTHSRYHVLHKLGHGGFGTVWLCRDTVHQSYIALKIMVASIDDQNLFDLKLAGLDRSLHGAEFIASPLDHFTINGPNGIHHCLVLPLLGPRVSPRLWLQIGATPGSILRKMAYQAASALDFLHKNNICHGDFRPANILVQLTNLDHLTEAELLSLLGDPTMAHVRTIESLKDHPASSPRYLVHPADLDHLSKEYIMEKICVIDFGEAFYFPSPPEFIGTPENYLPPELLLLDEEGEDRAESAVIGPSCDIWALGCTLFEIRAQMPLFYMIFDPDELIAEMVRFFGKLPDEAWANWKGREAYFDEDGKYIVPRRVEEEWSLEVLLRKPAKVERIAEGGKPRIMEIPQREQRLMADLLYKICQYVPERRLGTDKVLLHDWFKILD